MLKRFSVEKNNPVKTSPRNGDFSEI